MDSFGFLVVLYLATINLPADGLRLSLVGLDPGGSGSDAPLQQAAAVANGRRLQRRR